MRRSLISILVITVTILGLGLGEMAWTRLGVSSCQDWQAELQRRVESYARMHLPDPAPQVRLQSSCGHSFVADPLYFRWHKFLWRMGWRETRPLEESDLRMAATRDLMLHPDMGNLKFTVLFDATLSRDVRKKVEDLLSRYLALEGTRQKLEFRRVKKLPELPAAQGAQLSLAPLPLVARPLYPPLFPTPEPLLRASLLRAAHAAVFILLLCAGSLLFTQIILQLKKPRKKKEQDTLQTQARGTPSIGILIAPRVMQDWGERGREVFRLLQQLHPDRATARIRHAFVHEREGLVTFLGWMDSGTQEAMLHALTTDELLQLTDIKNPAAHPEDAQRSGLRLLLDLARELGQGTPLAQAPLFLQLMTRREWQRVSQQLTRPRRRALAELLDKERAGWLRGRQDLHPGWFESTAKESITLDQLMRRVRAILQAEADQLRDHLYSDREAVKVIDSYFSELTLDTTLNSDLMMLLLGTCLDRHAGFGSLLERQDPYMDAALAHCDDQQLALLLYDADPKMKAAMFTLIGSRAAEVRIWLRALDEDRQHGKSLRMQARSLQRFVERQVLVADLFCAGDQVERGR